MFPCAGLAITLAIPFVQAKCQHHLFCKSKNSLPPFCSEITETPSKGDFRSDEGFREEVKHQVATE